MFGVSNHLTLNHASFSQIQSPSVVFESTKVSIDFDVWNDSKSPDMGERWFDGVLNQHKVRIWQNKRQVFWLKDASQLCQLWLWQLWQFLPIVTNYHNFDKLWQFWPFMTILTDSNNFDQLWQFWLILIILTFVIILINYDCDNCDNFDQMWQFWSIMKTMIDCDQLLPIVTNNNYNWK